MAILDPASLDKPLLFHPRQATFSPRAGFCPQGVASFVDPKLCLKIGDFQFRWMILFPTQWIFRDLPQFQTHRIMAKFLKQYSYCAASQLQVWSKTSSGWWVTAESFKWNPVAGWWRAEFCWCSIPLDMISHNFQGPFKGPGRVRKGCPTNFNDRTS